MSFLYLSYCRRPTNDGDRDDYAYSRTIMIIIIFFITYVIRPIFKVNKSCERVNVCAVRCQARARGTRICILYI